MIFIKRYVYDYYKILYFIVIMILYEISLWLLEMRSMIIWYSDMSTGYDIPDMIFRIWYSISRLCAYSSGLDCRSSATLSDNYERYYMILYNIVAILWTILWAILWAIWLAMILYRYHNIWYVYDYYIIWYYIIWYYMIIIWYSISIYLYYYGIVSR